MKNKMPPWPLLNDGTNDNYLTCRCYYPIVKENDIIDIPCVNYGRPFVYICKRENLNPNLKLAREPKNPLHLARTRIWCPSCGRSHAVSSRDLRQVEIGNMNKLISYKLDSNYGHIAILGRKITKDTHQNARAIYEKQRELVTKFLKKQQRDQPKEKRGCKRRRKSPRYTEEEQDSEVTNDDWTERSSSEESSDEYDNRSTNAPTLIKFHSSTPRRRIHPCRKKKYSKWPLPKAARNLDIYACQVCYYPVQPMHYETRILRYQDNVKAILVSPIAIVFKHVRIIYYPDDNDEGDVFCPNCNNTLFHHNYLNEEQKELVEEFIRKKKHAEDTTSVVFLNAGEVEYGLAGVFEDMFYTNREKDTETEFEYGKVSSSSEEELATKDAEPVEYHSIPLQLVPNEEEHERCNDWPIPARAANKYAYACGECKYPIAISQKDTKVILNKDRKMILVITPITSVLKQVRITRADTGIAITCPKCYLIISYYSALSEEQKQAAMTHLGGSDGYPNMSQYVHLNFGTLDEDFLKTLKKAFDKRCNFSPANHQRLTATTVERLGISATLSTIQYHGPHTKARPKKRPTTHTGLNSATLTYGLKPIYEWPLPIDMFPLFAYGCQNCMFPITIAQDGVEIIRSKEGRPLLLVVPKVKLFKSVHLIELTQSSWGLLCPRCCRLLFSFSRLTAEQRTAVFDYMDKGNHEPATANFLFVNWNCIYGDFVRALRRRFAQRYFVTLPELEKQVTNLNTSEDEDN